MYDRDIKKSLKTWYLTVLHDLTVSGNATVTGTFTVGGVAYPVSGAGSVTANLTWAANIAALCATGTSYFDWHLGTGIFSTTSGANTLYGNVTINGTKTFTTGTGTVTINGATIFASVATTASGTSSFDLSGGSGIFKTSGGAVTIGPGAIGISGAVTFASAVGWTSAGGAGAFDLSGSSGTFLTPTGACTLKGDTTIDTNKALIVTTADKLTVGGIKIGTEIAVNLSGITATSTDQWIFTADAAYEVVGAKVIYTVASTSGTIDVKKSTTVQAPASGSSTLTGTISLSTTANTVNSGTPGVGAVPQLAAGNSLSACFAGTMTSLAGGVLTVFLKRI